MVFSIHRTVYWRVPNGRDPGDRGGELGLTNSTFIFIACLLLFVQGFGGHSSFGLYAESGPKKQLQKQLALCAC